LIRCAAGVAARITAVAAEEYLPGDEFADLDEASERGVGSGGELLIGNNR
jgi:hypothetical protein